MNKHLELTKLKNKYNSSEPFPHIVIDDFVDSNLLEDIINEFDTYQSFGHDPNSTQFQVKKLFSPYSAEITKANNCSYRIPNCSWRSVLYFSSTNTAPSG